MKKTILSIFCFFIFVDILFANEQQIKEIEIYKNLRCLVCQGQSIADSNSDFAQTIKLVVKDQISNGKKKKEIYDFLVEKYGEWIVYEPRINKNNFFLWFLPYLVLVLGGFIIAIIIKKKAHKHLLKVYFFYLR